MNRVHNKLDGRQKASAISPLLKPLTILALVLIGIFSFAALFVLIGYSDDLRQKETGQATPLSQSAIGYAGIVQLLDGIGYDVIKDPKPYKDRWDTRDQLRIYTPPNRYKSGDIGKLSASAPTLIILPKWNVTQLKDKPAWVRKSRFGQYQYASHVKGYIGDLGRGIYLGTLAAEDFPDAAGPAKNLDSLRYFTKIAPLPKSAPVEEADETDKPETTEADNDEANEGDTEETENTVLDELFEEFEIDDEVVDNPQDFSIIRATFDGKPYLIQIQNTDTYVLSDPDFINTMGLNTQTQAKHAVDMIEEIITRDELQPKAVTFDLSIHGVGGKPNLIKLMTQAPFLAATLCLLAAGGLVAWQGFSRFGDPARVSPDYSQGPASLAKTSAAFIASSGRLGSMGGAYADLTRRQVIRRLGLSGQHSDIIERRLTARETLRDISPKFEDLKTTNADRDAMGFTHRARALAKWKEEMIREP